MKLHRLELEGFGPFRARQAVDFDAFDRDGLFLISGRTGAGKSSILDGVCFALFGSVPRFGGGDRRLRSDHCAPDDPTEVRLELTVADTRWRVTRSPEYERPARRGGGTTVAPARAELEERVDGEWIGRAKGPRDVGHALSEVLGLGADQFQQVILLAQNQFSRFLLAGVRERQELLRTLFGTRRFERYRDDLKERAKRAQQRVADAQTRAATVLDLVDELVDANGLAGEDERPADLAGRRAHADRALQRARYRVETCGVARQRADGAAALAAAALQSAREDAATLDELAIVRRRIEQLDAAEPGIALDRRRLDRARAAAALRAPVETADRAAAGLDDARAAEAAAGAAGAEGAMHGPTFPEGAGPRAGDAGTDDGPGEEDPTDLDAIDALVAAITGDLARWATAEADERSLADATARLAALAERRAAHAEALARLDAALAALPDESARVGAGLVAARARAVRTDDLRARLDAALARLDAVRDAATLADETARLDADAAASLADAARAGDVVADLMRRRLAGYAGELAARLADGAPCEVCGSTAHPSPAAPSPEPVSDDDLQHAQDARDAAERAARDDADRAAQARAALAEAMGRTGGLTAEAVEHEVEAARAALADAEAAAVEVERLTALRAETDARAEQTRAERDVAASALAGAREETARTEVLAERLRADVDEARGPYDTVAARIAAAEARRAAAVGLRDAVARRLDAARAHDRAARDLDERIAASAFADAAEVVSALLDDAECAALDARIAEHAADRAATKERALDLELKAVSITAPVDLVAAEAVAAAEDAARTVAIETERDAVATAERLRDLLGRLDGEHAETQELADEAAVVARLADTVAGRAPNTLGMDLETFVLAAELEEIVRAANLRLSEMSAGRYTLHHTDARVARGASGLGIEVLDAHTGRLRSPQSLSGGETFLASLSLALGLADVVTSRAGGLRLDTLFVDEGFGSLDPETLELAMRTLDELRAGGRTVGLISHVEAMKEQIPAQLVVTASPDGPSTIAVR